MENLDNYGLVSEDKVKQVLVRLGRFLSSGEGHELLDIIGEVSKVSRGIKLIADVKNWHTTRKIRAFVETLSSQEINTRAYEEICEKYGETKVLAEVLIRLDRFSDEVHARVFAYLMAALLRSKLDWEEFITLNFCLELLNPQDIQSYTDKENLGASFVTAGIAYITYNYDGAPQAITPNGKRFNNFYDFGMKPYLDKREEVTRL